LWAITGKVSLECVDDFPAPERTVIHAAAVSASLKTYMSRYDNEVRVTLPVLDRLLDYEPEITSEPPSSRSKSLRLFKQAVKRDLEWLLNSRQVAGGISPDLEEVANSVAAYGLPDFTTASADNPEDRNKMRRVIEETISIFEPRLRDVSVTVEPTSKTDRSLHFRIDANLVVDPAPEPITFDTTLELVNGEYKINEK
jgi:type VI secretion system protein ImpF